ncbi:MAG: AraC family transcriptional regulator [Desulfomonilia bacterium]|jgi:AraC-like DNA-binding protein
MKNPGPVRINIASRPSLPMYRSINSIDILARYAAGRGIDVEKLLAGSGIKPRDLDDSEMFVSPKQELSVMRRLAELVSDPEAGLKTGEHYHITAHGVLGNASMCCETFLDAIRLMFSFIELTLTYFSYELSVVEPLAYVTMKELIDLKDIRRFICEREFVSVLRMMSDLIGEPLMLKEARFAYPRPEYASSYRDTFKCPVFFNTDEHVFIFDSRYLSKYLPMANRLSKDKYERECRELILRMKKSGTTSEKVRQLILYQKEGIPTFQQVTRRMNVSPRTLHRRLSVEGTSYKEILAEIRKTKAIEQLTETSTPVESIAMDLGYSDVANFYHAFKSWTGTTPISYRKKSL